MSSLNGYLEKKVKVITTDGRLLIGTMQGYDQSTNVILSGTTERIIYADEPVENIALGLYMLRGDSVCCIGLVDEQIETSIDWEKVRGSKLKGTKNPL